MIVLQTTVPKVRVVINLTNDLYGAEPFLRSCNCVATKELPAFYGT
jgi:hypothetical protein